MLLQTETFSLVDFLVQDVLGLFRIDFLRAYCFAFVSGRHFRVVQVKPKASFKAISSIVMSECESREMSCLVCGQFWIFIPGCICEAYITGIALPVDDAG